MFVVAAALGGFVCALLCAMVRSLVDWLVFAGMRFSVMGLMMSALMVFMLVMVIVMALMVVRGGVAGDGDAGGYGVVGGWW